MDLQVEALKELLLEMTVSEVHDYMRGATASANSVVSLEVVKVR